MGGQALNITQAISYTILVNTKLSLSTKSEYFYDRELRLKVLKVFVLDFLENYMDFFKRFFFDVPKKIRKLITKNL